MEAIKEFKHLLSKMQTKDCIGLGNSNGSFRDDSIYHWIEGIKTAGFKSKEVKGKCAVYGKGIVNPVIGNKYYVRIGDPEEFTAMFIKEIEIPFNQGADIIMKEFMDAGEGAENTCSIRGNTLLVFRQGTDEYLFFPRHACQIHKNKLAYWLS